MSTQLTTATKMLKPAPSPPHPPSNPSPQYKSTNNTMPVSIYPTTKKKKYKEKEINPFTVKASRRTHISI